MTGPLPISHGRRRFVLILLLLATLSPVPTFATGPKSYEAAVAALDPWIAREVADKRLPCLSIALVDDQAVVWAKGYGCADAARTKPATSETIYRVGTVSELFTAIAAMQLVEAGKLDLDAPVQQYLPDFALQGSGSEKIALRLLMTHRSGLIREPPVGSSFDSTAPSLAATVASLNATYLVDPPGTQEKDSHAAIATLGRVLEVVEGKPFASLVADRVLKPLGMTRSRFDATPEQAADRAVATMGTGYGREFPAPTFGLGIAPAAGLDSSVVDLSRFLKALFAGGRGANGAILRPKTLESMFWKQFELPEGGGGPGFGLGFRVDGWRQVGHSGAIHGCATELVADLDAKLGVIVIAGRDHANGLTTRIGKIALARMREDRKPDPLVPPGFLPPPPPPIPVTTALAPGRASSLAGRYRSPRGGTFDLLASAGRLWMEPAEGGSRVELRALDANLTADDVLNGFDGWPAREEGGKFRLHDATYERVPVGPPPAPPTTFNGLIGEYGWDHDVLFIFEKEGRLHALIDWFFLYPLTQEPLQDSTLAIVPSNKQRLIVFALPDWGRYRGEKLIFQRDPTGRATEVEAAGFASHRRPIVRRGPTRWVATDNAAGVVFKRRTIDGEDGRTFRIKPVRPVEAIRREIMGARPPVEPAKPRPAELVDLAAIVPGVKLDIRYATANNFLGTPVYTSARALMQRPAAEALAQVQAALAPQGYGLLVHDAYRPWRVTKLFWEATPPAQHGFVADPSLGSKHNRGCAVDLTLCDHATGHAVAMPGGYDEFSDRSYPDYPGGTARQRWHRDLLRSAMEAAGFTVNQAEWWHFDFATWADYPILDIPFEDLPQP